MCSPFYFDEMQADGRLGRASPLFLSVLEFTFEIFWSKFSEMRQTKSYLQIAFLVLWIFIVILLFKIIPDRRVVVLIAGLGFLFIPLGLVWQEYNSPHRSWAVLAGVLQFLFLFVIPILFKRLLYWNESFGNFTFFGIPAWEFHHYSAVSYILMISVMFISVLMRTKKLRPIENQ